MRMRVWRATRFLSTARAGTPESTIYALSTAQGRAAIAIVRVSGPDALKVADKLRQKTSPPLQQRLATLQKLYDRQSRVLDEALVVFFANKHSYTGDDLVELHLHGSPAVVRAVMDSIGSSGLARHAEPGEFTKRAFHNRRMDLSQVEGIRDLIDADTELQRQAAISGASGQTSAQLGAWRAAILHNVAMLTTLIDFADDNEIDTTVDELVGQVRHGVAAIRNDVLAYLQRLEHAEIVKDGLRVAIVGPPNAGKSSLLNYLLSRSVSIVSDIPGTTRDVVSASIDLGGLKFVLFDTAGVRDVTVQGSADQIELLGIERSIEVAAEADIILLLNPHDQALPLDIQQRIAPIIESGTKVIPVVTKNDLAEAEAKSDPQSISTVTGDGIEKLLETLHTAAESIVPTDSRANIIGASRRTRELLENQVLPGLTGAVDRLAQSDIILAEADLQLAADGIGRITGRGISANEILDVVFSSFCIGK